MKIVGKTTKHRVRPVAREPDPLLTRLGERLRNLRAIRHRQKSSGKYLAEARSVIKASFS